MNPLVRVFENETNKFHARVLGALGYAKLRQESFATKTNLDSCNVKFYNNELGITISISPFEHEPKQMKGISLTMYKDETADDPYPKSFFFAEFKKAHQIDDIQSTCTDDEDFEAFTQKYFSSLENAFKTYLKDQVTGMSFEAHNPLGK